MEARKGLAAFRTYTIQELGREFKCTARALRFYESEGLLAPTRRNRTRIFSHRDRARLDMITRGRKVGLTLRQIRDLFEAYEVSGQPAQDRLALQLFQARISELQAERASVDVALEKLRAAMHRLTESDEAHRAA